jgi:hypothetical protein
MFVRFPPAVLYDRAVIDMGRDGCMLPSNPSLFAALESNSSFFEATVCLLPVQTDHGHNASVV